MKRFLQKLTIYTLLITLFLVQVAPVVRAEAPQPPEAPSAPTSPEGPGAPPEAPSAPSVDQHDSNNNNWDNNEEDRDSDRNRDDEEDIDHDDEEDVQTAPETQSIQNENTDGGNVGDTEIETGDATSNGVISNIGNLNTNEGGGAGSGATAVLNSGNGTDSTNTGSVTVYNSDDTTQVNGAVVENDLNQGATTGDNEASNNVGNSSIDTGDANVSGTIVNAVNTNIDGVAVSEFNIVDDHVGDVILDFGNLNCIVGCGTAGNTSVKNTGNGSDSTNTGDVTTINTDNTFQSNDADVLNNMTLLADSGNNNADANTGGDSTVETGDASVAANVMNFVNNNIAGNVVFGVVNIFGDLIGDIILPENPFLNCSSCLAQNTTAANIGNGSGTDNTTNVTTINNDTTLQYNEALIENNILVDATTGDNSTSGNTGGSSTIETGDVDVNVQTLNIANTNLLGGDWWLVIVNQSGQWLGKIMGAPDGQNFAGSAGTEFVVDPLTGEITAMNSGNGADSTNNANVTTENNSNTTQINNAKIVNNLDLTANTGENSTNDNTGGNNLIKTGDAHVIANIVNFVNNNIAGNGRLFVTVVNVFGSWMGDLVTPGHSTDENAIAQTQESNSQNNNDSNNPGQQQQTQNQNNNSGGNTQTGNQTTVTGNTQTQGAITTTGNGENTLAIGQGLNLPSLIKGVNTTKEAAVKAISINLAWILLLTPLGALIIMRRKIKMLAMRVLPKTV